MVNLDRRAVGIGAAVAMVVGIPVATIGSVVLEDDSNLVFFFAALALFGFLAGGFVAGSKRPDMPMMHGAVAALVGFAVAQAIAAVLQVIRDEDVSAVAIVFNALLAANVGLLGGWIASRRAEQEPSSTI